MTTNLLSYCKTVPFEHNFSERDTKEILKGFENQYWKLEVINSAIFGYFKGQFLFKLDFALDDYGLVFSRAHLNRNPLTYKGTNDLQDLVDIHWMILRYLLKKPVSFREFKQRSIPLNTETAYAYILTSGDDWPEAEYKVSLFDVRNKVFSREGNFYLITDHVPSPSKFSFTWFDHLYPRGGSWTHTLKRSDCWTKTSRIEILAFDEILYELSFTENHNRKKS